SVTEWAVARIPASPDETGPDRPGTDTSASGPEASTLSASAPGPAQGLAVDDEPEDVAPAPVGVLTLERDGEVLPDERALPDDETPPPVDPEAPVPPRVPVAIERVAPPRPPRSSRAGGIERVGEAVVRQLLGATFVREEPYSPATRFSER
ncbi:MAG: DNA polymerase III subunit gamma and tau, partial [Microbacterium sp.]